MGNSQQINTDDLQQQIERLEQHNKAIQLTLFHLTLAADLDQACKMMSEANQEIGQFREQIAQAIRNREVIIATVIWDEQVARLYLTDEPVKKSDVSTYGFQTVPDYDLFLKAVEDADATICFESPKYA